MSIPFTKRFLSALTVSAVILGTALAILPTPSNAASAVNPSISMLVKTKTNTDVYWIKNGTRHAFPNAAIYQSWFSDYSQVKVISDARMNWVPAGKSVSPKPGSMLLTFGPQDNHVYEVTGENKISLIPTMEIAIAKYGNDWNLKVYQLSPSYLSDYEIE